MSAMTKPAFDRGAAERAAKAMFPNAALHRFAAAMAGCHPHALDYIRQAPVIVLAANGGKDGQSPYARTHATRSASVMRGFCERGVRLREVMRFYTLSLPLRALHPNALHPVRHDVIVRLGRMNPSTLAQTIPAARTHQNWWLRALMVWADQAERRIGDRSVQFEWAAVALRDVPRERTGDIEVVADLAVEASRADPQAGAVFDPRWTFDQAHAAADRWHEAMARRRAEVQAAHGLNIGFRQQFDYAPFSNEPVLINGFEFVPLRSCEDLYVEGAAMRHCVGGYSREVMSGVSRIFSVRQGGRRIATCEIGRRLERGSSMASDSFAFGAASSWPHALRHSAKWSVMQVRGPCNAAPPVEVLIVCSNFLLSASPKKEGSVISMRGLQSSGSDHRVEGQAA